MDEALRVSNEMNNKQVMQQLATSSLPDGHAVDGDQFKLRNVRGILDQPEAQEMEKERAHEEVNSDEDDGEDGKGQKRKHDWDGGISEKKSRTWFKRDEKVAEAIARQSSLLEALKQKVHETHRELSEYIDKINVMSPTGVEAVIDSDYRLATTRKRALKLVLGLDEEDMQR